MSRTAKPRADSKLKTLPFAQQEQVFALCQTMSYAAVRSAVRQKFGLDTSEAALSAFYRWYPTARRLEDAAGTADELAELGQTGELSLDDVARMSVKELRAAVRKVRAERERLKEVNAELNQEVIQHKVKGKVVAQTDWPAALETVSDQVAAAGRKLATALSELEACRIAIFTAGEPLNDAGRASFEAALGHVAELYEQALARAERSIERERATFDNTLGAFAEGA